ncbi:hypothetical protein DSO57_1018492 [Entomophthora muscae]|uniref:Uncharacterized protein n=1 Tax=Entomophthora muscae TaxID=34485 RepID=A0ACC2TR84_9FUNG|nr:hypothetical protein DSO57_1018492 [Entomophthora muscae]
MGETAQSGISRTRRWLICFGLVLGTFACALDETMVATTIAATGEELGDTKLLDWTNRSYILTSTACQLLYGKLSDVFGRKRVLLVALGNFAAGSLLQMVAKNMWMVVVARCVAGVGMSGLITLPYMVIADQMPLNERGAYYGVVGSAYALSNVVGPVVGGWIVDRFSWRWTFSISTLAASFALAVIVVLVPKDKNIVTKNVLMMLRWARNNFLSFWASDGDFVPQLGRQRL